MREEEEVPQPATAAPASDAIVDQWFADHFHNHGPALSVELTNHFIAAKEKLKKLLAANKED